MDLRRAAEGERKLLVKPLQEVIAMLNTRFKTMAEPVDKALDLMKKKMTIWYTAEEDRKEKEAARIEADNRKRLEQAKKPERVKIKETPVAPIKSVGSTTVTKRWTFKVVDETKVPREFLSLDSGLVRGAIRQGKREIAGLEIYQESSITTR